MTIDITKLADEWREEEDELKAAAGIYESCHDGFSCANELQAALAEYEWTEIAKELPPMDVSVMASDGARSYVFTRRDYHTFKAGVGIQQWRPLGSLDHPPKEIS